MKNRFRLQYTFWLDLHKPDEQALAETVALLKRQRAFAKAVRDGLRLIADLRAGHTDVLLELFPWVAEHVQPPTPPVNANLQVQIARLEALMMAQGNVPIERAQSPQLQKQLHASLLEVNPKANNTSTKTVAKNFVDSMKGFASGFFD